jgi:hypothetical protein
MGNTFGLFNEERAMPWGPQSMTILRSEFVILARDDDNKFRSLCRCFLMGAKTGYKWLDHFSVDGLPRL